MKEKSQILRVYLFFIKNSDKKVIEQAYLFQTIGWQQRRIASARFTKRNNTRKYIRNRGGDRLRRRGYRLPGEASAAAYGRGGQEDQG